MTHFAIGSSRLDWDGRELVVQIDEVGMPLPRRVRGTVRLTPLAMPGRVFTLDALCRHRWQPLAPLAHASIDLASPDLRWSGAAYLDSNFGAVPLEQDFVRWDWSCARLRDGAAVLYDCWMRDGTQRGMALRFDASGGCTPAEPPPPADLPRTRWWLERRTRGTAEVVRTLTDAPFYARSVLRGQLFGEAVESVHESLSLDRFRNPVVQAMLPFRMPRR